MGDFAAYLLYRASSAVISALPLSLVFRIGQFFGLLAWLFQPKYRHLALRNLTLAFGHEKSSSELRHIVRRHFQLLGANVLSSVKTATMSGEELERQVKIENMEAFATNFRAGVPTVLLIGHLGNWELFTSLMPRFFPFARSSSIYQRLSNARIDSHVRAMRSRAGLELFDRSQGFKPVIQLLREKGGVGVLSDQHAGDSGLWVPLFGKLASTSSLGPLLAKRTGATLFAAGVYTEGPGRWRMVFSDAFDVAGRSIEQLTRDGNAALEQQIRVAPEDWFWVHDRWKTPRPNFLLSKYKRGVYVPQMSADQLKPFRILVRSSNWLGDAVMSVPAVRAVKRGRPDAHVSVVTSAAIAPMWKIIKEVDQVIVADTGSIFSVVGAIRREPAFDAAILFPNSFRAGLEAWLARVPRRVGYRGHNRAWLLNQIVRESRKPKPPEHQAKRYLRIAHQLGADVENDSVGEPVRFPRDANSIPNKAGTSRDPMRLGLCPGAEYGPAKRWLPERFAEAAAAVTADRDVQWVLFGKPNDSEAGAAITQALGERCVNRIGETSLEQLIDELRQCRLLLTNDTGTMHLAGLLGVPTVAVFGSTEPRLTGPLGDNHTVVRHHVECSPCFLRKCPIDFRCMKAVTVEEVVQAVLAKLDGAGSRQIEPKPRSS